MFSLGSDFDGTITPGFDISELEAITHELLELGLSETEIRKVMGGNCLLYTSPSPRDKRQSRMPSSA